MKIAVAVTGASGAIYAKVLLDKLQQLSSQLTEVSTVWSDNAFTVWEHELDNKEYEKYPFKKWDKMDFMSPIASGSSNYNALIICPCSMGTAGRIAGGISNDLVTRAADVMLKERRKLVCMVRETPYNLIQLKNMTAITEAGGIICPATPSFYSQPKTLEEMAYTVIHRVLHWLASKVMVTGGEKPPTPKEALKPEYQSNKYLVSSNEYGIRKVNRTAKKNNGRAPGTVSVG